MSRPAKSDWFQDLFDFNFERCCEPAAFVFSENGTYAVPGTKQQDAIPGQDAWSKPRIPQSFHRANSDKHEPSSRSNSRLHRAAGAGNTELLASILDEDDQTVHYIDAYGDTGSFAGMGGCCLPLKWPGNQLPRNLPPVAGSTDSDDPPWTLSAALHVAARRGHYNACELLCKVCLRRGLIQIRARHPHRPQSATCVNVHFVNARRVVKASAMRTRSRCSAPCCCQNSGACAWWALQPERQCCAAWWEL